MAYVYETLGFKSGGSVYTEGYIRIWQDPDDPTNNPSYAELYGIYIYGPTEADLKYAHAYISLANITWSLTGLTWRDPLYYSSKNMYGIYVTNLGDIPTLPLNLLPGDELRVYVKNTSGGSRTNQMCCSGTLYMPTLVTITPPQTVMLNALNRFTCTPFAFHGDSAIATGALRPSNKGCQLYIDATTPIDNSSLGRTFTEFYWYPAYSLAQPGDFDQGVGNYYLMLRDLVSLRWYSTSYGGFGGVSMRSFTLTSGSTFEGTIVYNETPPASCAPAITLTATEISGVGILAQYGRYVKGKSQVQISAEVAYLYGAKETWFDLTVGFLYTQNKSITFWPESGGSVLAHAEDDHDGETDLTGAYLVYDYWTPGLTQAIHRCKQDGTRDDAGSYCLIEWEINVAPLGDQNSRSLTITHPAGTTSPTLSSYTASGSLIVPADPERSYEISYTLTDDFETVTRTVQLSTAGVIMDIFRGGHGISFGKVAEKDNTFEISSELDTLLNTRDAKLINLVDALTALAQATGVDIYVHDNE